jgi:hypothetical protein
MFPTDEPTTTTCATERQSEALPAHLAPLPCTENWALWKWVGLRGAGFAAQGVLALASTESAQAADELLRAEAGAEQLWESALDAVNYTLTTLPWKADGTCDDPRVLPLVKAMRLLKKGKLPPLSEESTTEGEAVRELQSALARVDQAHAEYVRCFEAAQASANKALRAVAEDRRFREAVTWQNRRALRSGIDSMLREQSATKQRKNGRLVASYLQRYCTKNDSIGFFGPIGWARISSEADSVNVRPGRALLASREVYFECWTIDALCQRLSQDAELRPWMRPRRMPSVRVAGRTLHLPFKTPVELTPQQSLLLMACDGETTACDIARQLVANSGGVLNSEQHVYRELEQLAEQELIAWCVEVGDEPRGERRLRKLLEGVEAVEVRGRALELLEKMERARGCVAQAAGDAELLERAVAEMEELFEHETGRAATRKGGQVYAGRTLVYEDCRRDVKVEIGAEVLQELSGGLGLMLESARWMAWKTGEEYRRALHNIYRSLVEQSGSSVLDIEPFWLQAEPLLIGSEPHLLDKVVREFQEKWAEVFSLNADARAVQYTSEELRRKVAATFASPRTAWSAAHYHSPDVMIAADSVEAIRRGDYLFVMGELHVATNTLSSSTFVSQHPSPEDLYAAIASDLPRPRVVPVLPKNAHFPKRSSPVLTSPEDFFLEYAEGAPGLPTARALRASTLVVEASGSDLFVRTRDGRLRFDIIEFFGSVLSGSIIDKFKLFKGSEHQARVSIDRLVVQRESWTIPAAEMTFAHERADSDRFLEARRFQQQHEMPRHVFAKVPVEVKPVYVDFESEIYVNMLGRLIRRSVEEGGDEATVTISEMMPGMNQLWLPDAEGNRYTSEFRFVALDLHASHT